MNKCQVKHKSSRIFTDSKFHILRLHTNPPESLPIQDVRPFRSTADTQLFQIVSLTL
jgi:hypothetical protein